MIVVEKNIQIPEHWHELTQQQAVETIVLIEGFFRQEYDLRDFRLFLLKALSGYKPNKKKYKPEVWEQITFNLYTLSELLQFPIKPHYHNPDLLHVLSDNLREKLQMVLPVDIAEANDLKQLEAISSILKWDVEINLDMRKNIVPEINSIPGPVFNIDEYGVVSTNMIAAEYIDAYDFFNLYNQTRSNKYLNCFIAALYRPNRKEYSTYDTQQRALLFDKVDINVKKAVCVWFRSFLEYLCEKSQFTWLFSHNKTEEKGFSLGLSNTVNQLASKGYGSKKEVEMYPIEDYFNIQLKELVESVKNMKDMEVKLHEIQQKTGLTAEIIAQI